MIRFFVTRKFHDLSNISYLFPVSRPVTSRENGKPVHASSKGVDRCSVNTAATVVLAVKKRPQQSRLLDPSTNLSLSESCPFRSPLLCVHQPYRQAKSNPVGYQ